ncbi:MAG TPA: hypothetical protein VFN57_06615 [Thermomicrobiaceae bacterium]|nr:hypothetical protein [Thermomicrobiaceae bacterium]
MLAQPPRRWTVFTRSVVSAVGNPDAYLFRALGDALAAAGYDALFFEDRANPAAVELLRVRGARALDDLRARHPSLHYRTVQPRGGLELAEWLGGVLATADIAIVQHDAPAELARAVGRLTRPHLQTFLLDSGLGVPLDESAVAERHPERLSGVFVGRANAADAYAAIVSPDRLHRFGPPEVDDGPLDDGAPGIVATADELVLAIARLAAGERGTVPGTNGTSGGSGAER